MALLIEIVVSKLNQLTEKYAKKGHYKIATILLHITYLLEGKNDGNNLMQEGIWLLKSKKYKKAIKKLNQCVERGIQIEKSLKLLGTAYRLAGKYEKAIGEKSNKKETITKEKRNERSKTSKVHKEIGVRKEKKSKRRIRLGQVKTSENYNRNKFKYNNLKLLIGKINH